MLYERLNTRRRYSHNRLVTWIVSRCMTCGRFIGGIQRKYCNKCKGKMKIITIEEWKRNNRERINTLQKIRRHKQGINLKYRGGYK